MKKIILSQILLLSVVIATAQVRTGIGAGLNLSTISINEPGASVTPDNMTGFKGYVFFEGTISKSFFIQPEFSYEGMGWKYTGEDPFNGGNNATVKNRMNYLLLTVLLKYKFENTGFALGVGPAYGLLLSAKSKGYQGTETDTKDAYTGDNFAVIPYAEYFFPIGIGITARYFGGIKNIAKDHEDGESVHMHGFSFTVAYLFGGGHK